MLDDAGMKMVHGVVTPTWLKNDKPISAWLLTISDEKRPQLQPNAACNYLFHVTLQGTKNACSRPPSQSHAALAGSAPAPGSRWSPSAVAPQC